ncbi:MAG: hypothetical protein IJS15_11095 [Victivallales bacterium]|nr:hypothetical protein [Victivallales bacterium]
MFKTNYKDLPNRHKKLLHFTAAALFVMLILMWFVIYPRLKWRASFQEEILIERAKLKKSGVPLDARMLNDHIRECIDSLEDTGKSKGLVSISNDIIERATRTFDDDIRETYPKTESSSSMELFYNNSTRIDYKDLYDRITSEFKEYDISISQKTLEPDEDNSEPVFQLMLKLWTMRYLVRAAVKNNLLMDKDEEGFSRINAMRTTAYTLSPNDMPYLLEFPIVLRFSGTMENFLSFIKSLQNDNLFIPMKTILVNSRPPSDFPPGESRDITGLSFRVTCSSFFKTQPDKPVKPTVGESGK